jgi:hypothetical protein
MSLLSLGFVPYSRPFTRSTSSASRSRLMYDAGVNALSLALVCFLLRYVILHYAIVFTLTLGVSH